MITVSFLLRCMISTALSDLQLTVQSKKDSMSTSCSVVAEAGEGSSLVYILTVFGGTGTD